MGVNLGFSLILSLVILTGSGTIQAEDRSIAELPQAKKQQWAGIQKALRDELAVCREHCGYDKACEERCEGAFKYRLEIEYKKLMSESR